MTKFRTIPARKTIALVSHDSRKKEMLEWSAKYQEILAGHDLVATSSTGTLIEKNTKLKIRKMISGPLGGDQQIGSEICEGKIHMLFFLWDPLSAQPHDPDVKALLRIATLWNIILVCNRSTADFIISSPLFQTDYQIELPSIVKPYLNIDGTIEA